MLRHLIIILLFFPFFVFASQNASIKCLSVETNGDVNISWEIATDDCSIFTAYEIYSSNSYSGSFSLLQSIPNISTSSFIHFGAGANTQKMYYYIKTISACGSLISDTLNTILLDVTNPVNGYGHLDWNSMHSTPVTGQNAYYYIYRAISSAGFQLIDSVIATAQIFDEEIYTCDEFYYKYKILFKNDYGCSSISNVDSVKLVNKIRPNISEIDTVSVFPSSGKTIISWSKCTSPDAYGYIIYMEHDANATSWYPLDTIFGVDNTTYINNTSQANYKPEYYRVSPIDTCLLPAVMGTIHGTMYAFPYFDDCLARIRLDWTHYIGWTESVSQYKIYCKIDNQPEILLGAVPGNVREFYHSDIIGNLNYCYYIRAFNSDGTNTSTSNLTCFTSPTMSNPSILNADYATVDSYNSVKLSFTIDPNAELKYLKLMRADNFDGPYEQIDKLNTSSSKVAYIDYADIIHKIYYYKTIAVNKCGVDIKESNIANNIVLELNNNSHLKHELNWNSYNNWLGDVSYFNIYRSIDDGIPELIYQQYYGIYTYTDDISVLNLNQKAGKFCYYIEAVEGDFNPYGIKGISKSNIACTEQFPRVFMANAFTPNYDDLNDLYIPNVLFASPLDYTFKIYNRWGEVIFTTNNPSIGWNGNNTVTQKRCEAGTYVYYIYFTTAENKVFEQSGQVTLYYP